MKQTLINAVKEYFNGGLVAVPVKISITADPKDPTRNKKKPRFGVSWQKQPEFLNANAIIGVIESGFTSYYSKTTKKPIKTDYNSLALLTGEAHNLIVLDIDTAKPSGYKTLEKLGIQIPDKTPCVRTQSGGRHYYFKFPRELKGFKTTKSFGKDYHIDIRGDGGLVFAPPTKIDDTADAKGGEYEWIEPFRNNLPNMPRKLLDFIIEQNNPTPTKPTEKPKPPPKKEYKDDDPYKFVPDAVNLLSSCHLDYDNWCQVGLALASMGEEGRSFFQQISNNPAFNDTPQQIDNKFDNFLNTGSGSVKIASLFKIAKDNGFQYPRQTKPERQAPKGELKKPTTKQQKTESTIHGLTPQDILLYAVDQDKGDAILGASLLEGQFLFDFRRTKWLKWNGTRWAVDEEESIRHTVSTNLYKIYEFASVAYFSSIKTESSEGEASRIKAHAKILRAKQKKACEFPHMTRVLSWMKPLLLTFQENFDINHDSLNVANGTIDLKTQELKPHDPKDLISKQAPVTYNKDAKCPEWEKFLETVIVHPDDPLEDGTLSTDGLTIGTLQKYAGLCLSGHIKEQKFLYLYGLGANGKSIFITTLSMLLGAGANIGGTSHEGGGYVGHAPIELFIHNRQKDEAHRLNYLAELQGARLVVCDEIEGKRVMSESAIKSVTSGIEKVNAMRKFEKPFSYNFTGKLILFGNHRLTIKSSDRGIWRRVLLNEWYYNFEQSPHREDSTIVLKRFQNELSGILNWALTGLKNYEREGLKVSKSIIDTTEQYKDDADQLKRWLDEKCTVAPEILTTFGEIYTSYKNWVDETDEYKAFKGKNTLISELLERDDFNFKKVKKGNQGFRIEGLRVNFKTPDFTHNST